METPTTVQNRFGDACASADGITFKAGVNTGTINIKGGCLLSSAEKLISVLIVVKFSERPRNIPFPKAAYDATFDAAKKEHVASCLPGTRVEVLKEIQKWMDGDNPKKLYWLNGMAEKCSSGSELFLLKGGGDLASASRFASTIAIQLCEVSAEMRGLIEKVVDDNPRLDSLNVQEQWDKLIIQPISEFYQHALTGSIGLLLVIDALDECNNTEDVNVLIRCLERVTQIEGANCRVFLTSRPDQPIKAGLGSSTSVPRESFILHNIEKSILYEDLGLYYRDQFTRMRATMSFQEDVISDSLIASLVERSHGLFIHAATVCRFNRRKPTAQIKNWIRCIQRSLNTLSSFVSVTDGLSLEETRKIHELFQRIIGAIITISDAMSSENLALLLGEKRERIDTTLGYLHSVIDVPESKQELIRILHPSFRELLLDNKRCTNKSYSILGEEIHGYLLNRCFDFLISQLRRNPLHISQPGAKARDASIDRINTWISIPLQYSSKYWWNHFENSSDKWRANVPLLELLQDKYLYWLECLAWLGKLPQGKSTTLISSKHWKQKTESLLRSSISDGLYFLLSSRIMIEGAPLQLYVSVLLFTPMLSDVRITNYKEVPKWILNKPSTREKWGESDDILSIHHSSRVRSIAVSSDITLIATACDDRMVHIWDATNGTERLALQGNTMSWASVSFSPDGCIVASLVNNTVSMWNIRGVLGRIPHPDFQFHLQNSVSLTKPSTYPMCAFYPDGILFAAGSYPHDIWVWDMRFKSAVKFHLQAEHSTEIGGLCFSPDGSLLISVSQITLAHPKPNFNIWDTCTGTEIGSEAKIPGSSSARLLCGTKHITISSPTSKEKMGLVLCDIRTGADFRSFPLGFFFPDDALFRPQDGKLLLAKCSPNQIWMWPPDEFRKTFLFTSGNHPIESFVFSPNGRFIIAVKAPNELVIWNIEDVGRESPKLVEMYRRIRNMGHFIRSPNGKLLTTWKDNSIAAVWDTNTGKEKCRFETPISLTYPIFSSDGNVLAVLVDTGIHFWHTETGQKGQILRTNDEQTLGTGCFQVSAKGEKFIYIPQDTWSQPFCECQIWDIHNHGRVSNSTVQITSCEKPGVALSPNAQFYAIWCEESTFIEIRSFSSISLQRRTFKQYGTMIT
ncbi:hypothetical protein N7509_013164 [Penicillium cosmopolitanum]|uniref:Nephrocystin 3-like N-terminal domain-containing protein n=1 Tax=Penicillium cosmopolitanum TaxID=1131564 RepID=A0A9W9SCU4_9EURO|nr:uncharacterized protein N7509_013164 [Penicillium cosmopolitanum]KAJ5376278.1 hypothetical protein N7509_013164 [Penicillium cosmopolitanum]